LCVMCAMTGAVPLLCCAVLCRAVLCCTFRGGASLLSGCAVAVMALAATCTLNQAPYICVPTELKSL
jgi:hypothetical protein